MWQCVWIPGYHVTAGSFPFPSLQKGNVALSNDIIYSSLIGYIALWHHLLPWSLIGGNHAMKEDTASEDQKRRWNRWLFQCTWKACLHFKGDFMPTKSLLFAPSNLHRQKSSAESPETVAVNPLHQWNCVGPLYPHSFCLSSSCWVVIICT